MIYIDNKTDMLALPQNGFVTGARVVYKYKIYKAGRPALEVMSGHMTADEISPNMITWRPDEETMLAVKSLEGEHCLCLYDIETDKLVSMCFIRPAVVEQNDTADIVEEDIVERK